MIDFVEIWRELKTRISKDCENGFYNDVDKGRFCFIKDIFVDDNGYGIVICFDKENEENSYLELTIYENGTFVFEKNEYD